MSAFNGFKLTRHLASRIFFNGKVVVPERGLSQTPARLAYRVLLLSSAYNGLTQRIHTNLVERDHQVKFRLSISPENISKTVKEIQPDFVICPFLKEKIPEETWKEYLCLVFHPGIPGDGGCHSLDWAILNQEQEWGGTLLAANDDLDGGDIWATDTFPMPQSTSKANLYRGQLTRLAVNCVDTFIEKYDKHVASGEPLSSLVKVASDFEKSGKWRHPATQKIRKIDWNRDTTSDIIRKIESGDSAPGVLDTFFDEEVFLYGVHAEDVLKGDPKRIICTRNGAVCIGTRDGAVWITHMRQKRTAQFPYKLPAARILAKQLEIHNIPESSYTYLPTQYVEYVDSKGESQKNEENVKTYRDIWYQEYKEIGILNFNFYNGAMSTDDCKRLTEAYAEAKKMPTKVLVLAGRGKFFSNGIHLNVIESSGNDDLGESWRNINAMNGVVREILSSSDKITVSAVEGNAGAGGVFLAIASDQVWLSENSVLNPHYKTMGLFGSEYHTYTLPRRVGEEKKQHLLDACLPVNATAAVKLGLADKIIMDKNFQKDVITHANELSANYSALIYEKRAKWIEEASEIFGPIGKNVNDLDKVFRDFLEVRIAIEEELENMYMDFQSERYHEARRDFVLKTPAIQTPKHLENYCPGDIFKI